MSVTPTQYTVDVFSLGQQGPLASDQWVSWASATPLVVEFTSGLAVQSLWFPSPQGPMSFYNGPTATGTPFFTTDGSVPELVSIPNDAPVITVTGPGATMSVYASSWPYAPFRGSVAPVLDITVNPPIVNTGSSSVPILGMTTPLPVIYGGTGDTNPSLEAGANINITGSWPNQTVTAVLGAGGVQTVTVNAPLVEGGTTQNPIISLPTLPTADGGTGTTNPYLEGDPSGILVNGADNVQDDTFQWVVSLGGFIEDSAGNPVSSGPAKLTVTGGIATTQGVGNGKNIQLDTTALQLVTGGITSSDSSVSITSHAGSQSNDLSVVSSPGDIPAWLAPSGGQVHPHIVFTKGGQYTVSYSYSSPPQFVLEANSRTAGGFTVDGYADNGSIGSTTVSFPSGGNFTNGSSYAVLFSVQTVSGGNITFDIFCIGT